MSFPTTTYNNESAGAGLVSVAAAAGLDLTGLQQVAQLQSAVANLIAGGERRAVRPKSVSA